MKICSVFLLGLVVAAHGSVFRLQSGYDAKYSIRVEIYQFQKNSALFGDVLLRKHADHIDLRWQNEDMTDEGDSAERLLPKIRAIKQPLNLTIDSQDYIYIDHEETRSLWTFLFPFNFESFRTSIEKGEGFQKPVMKKCAFFYDVNLTNPDFYELNMAEHGTSCKDIEAKSKILVRKEDLTTEEHFFRLETDSKRNTIEVTMKFVDFVKIADA